MADGSGSSGQRKSSDAGSAGNAPAASTDNAAGVIANLTHELKTPLHSILAVAGLLRAEADGPLTEEQARQVEIILRNGESLLELITNLLDYSSAAASSRKPKMEWVNVRSFMAAYIESMRSVADEKQVKLTEDVSKAPEKFATDLFLLRQIVNNLVSNAVKFSSGSEVMLVAELQADASLRIQVGDSGIGMAPEVREAIFNEFYQGDSGDTKRYGGVGLGLSLVKASVEQLGGRIQVQSEKDRGTLFTVALPDAEDLVPEYRILIVEPDAGVRLSLDQLFKGEGYSVSTASEPGALIEHLAENRPHITLLDLGEPPQEVFETVRAIRAESWGGQMPIILMSGYDGPDERAASFECGATDYVVKPFDVAEVAARVKMHLAKV